MALALPAASVPPTSVQATSQPQSTQFDAGQVPRREHHRRHRRDEEELDDPGLREGDVGADRVGAGASGRGGRLGVGGGGGHVGAGAGRAILVGQRAGAADARGARRRPGPVVGDERRARRGRPDERGERHVERLGPRSELGPDLERPDDRLEREEDSGDGDQPEHGGADGARAAAPPGGDPETGEHDADDDAHVAVEGLREGQRRGGGRHVAERRHHGSAHQRPVGEDEGGVERRHVGAEDEEDEGRRGREGGEQREALARAASRQAGRVSRPDEQERQEAGDGHRGGEMRRDRGPGVAEADGLPAQPGLEADQGHRAERRDEEAAAVAMVDDGEDRDREDHDADDRRDEAVDPLRPGLEVERRDDLPVAERPVRAAQPRARGPHDNADDHEGEGHGQRRRDELLEPGHRTSGGAVRGNLADARDSRPPAGDARDSGADCIVPARGARGVARPGARRPRPPAAHRALQLMPLAASRAHRPPPSRRCPGDAARGIAPGGWFAGGRCPGDAARGIETSGVVSASAPTSPRHGCAAARFGASD